MKRGVEKEYERGNGEREVRKGKVWFYHLVHVKNILSSFPYMFRLSADSASAPWSSSICFIA